MVSIDAASAQTFVVTGAGRFLAPPWPAARLALVGAAMIALATPQGRPR